MQFITRKKNVNIHFWGKEIQERANYMDWRKLTIKWFFQRGIRNVNNKITKKILTKNLYFPISKWQLKKNYGIFLQVLSFSLCLVLRNNKNQIKNYPRKRKPCKLSFMRFPILQIPRQIQGIWPGCTPTYSWEIM